MAVTPGVITRGTATQAAYSFEEVFASAHASRFFRRPLSLKPYCTRDCVFCDENVLLELMFSSKANMMLKRLRKNRLDLLTVHAHQYQTPAVMLEIEYAVRFPQGYRLNATRIFLPPEDGHISRTMPLVRKVYPLNKRNHYGEGAKWDVDNKLYEQLAERILEVQHDLRVRRDHHGLTR